MKFLEFTTNNQNKVLLNFNEIEGFVTTTKNEHHILTYKQIYVVSEQEYNRITQTIDKVDHL